MRESVNHRLNIAHITATSGYAILALVTSLGLLQPSTANAESQSSRTKAQAAMSDNEGHALGSVTLTEAPHGILLDIALDGVPPGYHAIHLHRIGDCSDQPFKAAGGHINVFGHQHGLLNPEGPDQGDLPNIYAHENGTVRAQMFNDRISLTGPARPAILDYDGAAVVMHEMPDDHSTQPIGGAGARIGCGVIKMMDE